MVGSLGPVVFQVSTGKARTFSGMKRDASARIASHEVMGGKPLLEFLGPGEEKISFTMTLSKYLGIDPEAEIKQLREMRDKGKAVMFILNGMPQGEGLWLVESLSEDWDDPDNRGRARTIRASVSLREYVEVRDG